MVDNALGIPAGAFPPDWGDAHYRYLWRAQYDRLGEGPTVYQLDERGNTRSVAVLNFDRVVRLELMPMRDGYPPLEVRCDPASGQRIVKYWQCELCSDGSSEVREVLGIEQNVNGTMVRVLALAQIDRRIVISTNANI